MRPFLRSSGALTRGRYVFKRFKQTDTRVLEHKKNDLPIKTSLCGPRLLNDPVLNKGAAFSREERITFGLEALLPYQVHTLETQSARAYRQLGSRSTPLAKFTFLQSLRDQNECLYYFTALKHLKEVLPVIYTPTVGEAIQHYSELFRRPSASADSLFLSYADRGRLRELMLDNRDPKDIDLIVCTDSEGILGIGDQGVGGILICQGKSQLYSLAAGVEPSRILSVALDVGTDNQELLNDPLYLGMPRSRVRGEEYDAFMDEFFGIVRKDFPDAMLHCEDFGVANASRLLSRYREQQSVFNDDMQGTAAVALAALLSATRVTKSQLKDQRIVIFGFGTAGLGIANGIRNALMLEEGGSLSEEEANKCFWGLDRRGLLTGDMELRSGQEPYARTPEEVSAFSRGDDGSIDLLEVIKQVKPTVLIGTSTKAGAFNQQVVEEMSKHCERPIIFPLSNPTRLAECDPADANKWSHGKALIATGSPFPPAQLNGKTYQIAEANNALVYPGLGHAVIVSKASKLTDKMITAGVNALAKLSPALKDPDDSLLPGLHDVRTVSVAISTAAANAARAEGVSKVERDTDWTEDEVRAAQWDPVYRPLELVK